ncbi:MAG TPA: MFS transporter, partial [Oceanipulchritudo sp.]|nr:MFS transporter [Oceanipulchritudo sp.]
MSEQTNQAKLDPAAKLGWGEKFGYAAGDMASCLYFGIFMNFLAIFYTDVFGISPAVLGTMLLFTRTWDWINDPIMGAIADRTNTKMGKFRPWLLWMIPPYVVFGILTFTTFDLGPTGKVVYAYATYTMLMMIYTAINVPYGALMGVMTAKSDQRTILASFRFVGANTGIFTVTLLLPFLVKWIGGDNQQLGYSGAVSILAVMAGALFFITFKTSTERIRPAERKHEPFREEMRELIRNIPWLIVIALSILTVLGQAVRATSTLHFFKYVTGHEDWGTRLLLFNAVAAVIAVLLSKFIVDIIGCKKRAYIILNLLFAGLLVWFYFIPIDSFPTMVVNQILMAFVAAPMMPLFWSMIADTADYGATKFGHRSTGIIFSAGTASQKIGWTVGPALAMLILSGVGYVANADQSPATIQALRLLMSIIPAGFAVLTALVTWFYPINRKVEQELEEAMSKMS